MADKKPPTWLIRTGPEFRQPFRFDFDKPFTKDFLDGERTEFFNYGFSDITMNTYIRSLKIALKTIDKDINPDYVHNESDLTNLNDDIPLDFGGMSNIYDKSLLKNDIMPGLADNSDELVKFFIENVIINKDNSDNKQKEVPPLVKFVSLMYPNPEDEFEGTQSGNTLVPLIAQLEENIRQKFEQSMTKYDDMLKRDASNKNANFKRGPYEGKDRRDYRDNYRDSSYKKDRRDDRRGSSRSPARRDRYDRDRGHTSSRYDDRKKSKDRNSRDRSSRDKDRNSRDRDRSKSKRKDKKRSRSRSPRDKKRDDYRDKKKVSRRSKERSRSRSGKRNDSKKKHH